MIMALQNDWRRMYKTNPLINKEFKNYDLSKSESNENSKVDMSDNPKSKQQQIKLIYDNDIFEFISQCTTCSNSL